MPEILVGFDDEASTKPLKDGGAGPLPGMAHFIVNAVAPSRYYHAGTMQAGKGCQEPTLAGWRSLPAGVRT